MKTSRFICMVLAVAMVLSLNIFQFESIHAEDKIYATTSSPAIPVTVGEAINLEDVMVEFSSNVYFRASDVNITVTDDSKDTLKIENGKLTASEEGLHIIMVEKNNIVKTVYVVARASADGDFVLFFDEFEAELLDGYRRVEGFSSDVYVENGFLFLKGNTLRSPRLLLPEFLDDFGDYEIEVVGTITDAAEQTRWSSIMYRSQNNNAQYLQMCIRKGATANNGIEIAENTGGWTVHKTASYKEAISSDKMYTFKVHAEGPEINYYINSEKVLSGKLEGYIKGGIGLQANNSTFKIDSLKVKYVAGKPGKAGYTFFEIVQPDMGIIGGMGLSEFVENQDDLTRIAELGMKPANVIFYIDKELNVTDNTYSNPYMGIEDAIMSLMGVMTPTFYINDEHAANNLGDFLKDNKLEDCFVMSGNPELVQIVRKKARMSRGVIDFTEKYKDKESVSKDDLMEIRGIVNSNMASVCVIPSNIANRVNVKFLYDRLVSVWVNAVNDLTQKKDAYSLLITGAHGIISDNTHLVYETAMLMSGSKLLRVPLNVGHRGVPSLAPENTIEGALLAYENGADVIEIDIHLTKDGVPVIIHDANTARTCNGVSREVRNSTVEQLKELNANSGRTDFGEIKIPTLEEFYEAIKDLDVFVFVELKSTEKELVTALREATLKYDMTDRISVITFHTSNITNMNREFPEMSVGYLMGASATGATSDLQTRSVLGIIQPYGTTYNPSYNYHSKDFFTKANMRGITTWPWTINNEVVITYFLAGANGITTDTCQILAPFTKFLNAKKLEHKLEPGDNLKIEATRTTYGREEIDASEDVRIIFLEGEELVTVNDGVLTFKKYGTVVYALEYTHEIDENNSYTVYSEPVTIAIEVLPGSSNTWLIIAIAAGVVVVAAAVILSIVFRKKKNNT
ncbi:MAG TPA: glycerophosphodiester phosphodiesterase family protein [Clostridia bacterium]|nr:glycerophosphodiester phosphodiesterase family protein [Clostridia bacterium]